MCVSIVVQTFVMSAFFFSRPADAWHERLVRYYSYFGFKPIHKVGQAEGLDGTFFVSGPGQAH